MEIVVRTATGGGGGGSEAGEAGERGALRYTFFIKLEHQTKQMKIIDVYHRYILWIIDVVYFKEQVSKSGIFKKLVDEHVVTCIIDVVVYFETYLPKFPPSLLFPFRKI